ncbi:MAG: FHA domain-containing protein [Candidatus Pacearchaeota archaeon]
MKKSKLIEGILREENEKFYQLPEIQRSFELDNNNTFYTIGRNEKCDIKVPNGILDVSRLHAVLKFNNGNWEIYDMGSLFGTYVIKKGESKKEKIENKLTLSQGDIILLGSLYCLKYIENKENKR